MRDNLQIYFIFLNFYKHAQLATVFIYTELLPSLLKYCKLLQHMCTLQQSLMSCVNTFVFCSCWMSFEEGTIFAFVAPALGIILVTSMDKLSVYGTKLLALD